MSIARVRFESLVHAEHAAVYRVAARLLSPADAEDVTQQVFTRVWEGKATLGQEPAVTLRYLAGRLALNALRGARTRRRHEERSMHTEPNPSPPADFTQQDRDALCDALDGLPFDLRTAVALRYQTEFTFDEVARALSCSLSTAHDRVRRGLERLRHTLTRGHYAVLAARLPELLLRLESASPVPPALATRLLAVPEAAVATTLSAGAWPIAVLALIGLGVTLAFAWSASEPAVEASVARAAGPIDAAGATASPQDPPPSRRPVATPEAGAQQHSVPMPARTVARAPQDQPADGPTARVFGHVFDADDGRPLVQAKAFARSLARGRKGEDFIRSTITDATGSFALDLPVAGEREGYTVWIQASDYVQLNQTHTLIVGAAVEVRAALRRWAKDVPGDWTMEVSVLDDLGAPVDGANITVHRRQATVGGRDQQPKEVTGKTDATGRLTLRGTHHGEKLVHVTAPYDKPDPAAAPHRRLAAAMQTLEIRGAGPHALGVTLAHGKAIAGVVRAVASGQPVPQFSIRALQSEEEIGWAFTDAEGRFRVDGLGAEAITLTGHGASWSSFLASGYTPGDEHVDLLVKERTDTQPRGLFMGELHGRAVDAASGEPVVLSVWDVRATAWPTSDTEQADQWEELLNPRPVQTAMEGPLPAPAPDFHVGTLPAGRYGLIVRHRDYAPRLAGPFDVAPAHLIRDIDLQLAPGGSVSGTVTDQARRPVGRAIVYVTARLDAITHATSVKQALAGGDRYPHHHYTACDPQGAFHLDRVPAGMTLRLVAVDGGAGVAASEPFTLRDGEVKTLSVRLQ